MVLASVPFVMVTGCALCYPVLCQAIKTKSLLLNILQTFAVVSDDIKISGRKSILTVDTKMVFTPLVSLVVW